MEVAMATVRYFVTDVERAVAFYTQHLGFETQQQFGPNMAILKLRDLTLWLAGPNASASRPVPSGAKPVPGGWNRFVIEVADLAATVAKLKGAGAHFRNEIVSGPGGQQILIEDPFGNVAELFQPA
jgi:catechol 2,3-dioxygenase-like lactoylglutathione lyase family enzyme